MRDVAWWRFKKTSKIVHATTKGMVAGRPVLPADSVCGVEIWMYAQMVAAPQDGEKCPKCRKAVEEKSA